MTRSMTFRTQRFVELHDFSCWCGQRESRAICTQSFGRHHFVVLECTACGTHRILPKALADQASAETLYNEYQGLTVPDSRRDAVAKTALERLARTEVPFDKARKVLDVGCGNGIALEAICNTFGCAGHGIDVDRRQIERAKKSSGPATFECDLFDPRKLENKYDIVISFAVVEHVVDPAGFLTQLHSALTDGGSLFLLTPNAQSLNYRVLKSWWRELLSIGEHIYLFTPKSLEACAARAGFKLVKLSSDFDWSIPPLRFNTLRNWAVTFWAWYCELVKRVTACFASTEAGDILYAHFKKL
jgi:2-polyprenyl-3-methyl-5-hydroxy-6-metoxy-1,4-benzoquinol methylase